MFQITRIKVFQNSHGQTQFLIKLVAALLVWSSNLLTPNQCLRLKRSVDGEIIFTLMLPASDTPVMSVGKLPFSQKQRKVWEETEEENRKEMRLCKDPWRVSHKASAMTNITLLRCWQGREKIEKDIKKRASYNIWLTEGHGWTLKDSKELFRGFGWVKTVWIYPQLLQQTPIATCHVLPSSSYHLHWCSWVISSSKIG